MKISGTEYKKPCGLFLSFNNDSPKIGELKDILYIKGEVYFHVQVRETEFFSEHFQAYVLGKSSESITIHHEHLLHFAPFHLRNIKGLTTSGQKAIILKHHISTP